MYCPKCGEEIIIVSDFDIKLEDNIDTTVILKTAEIPVINIDDLNTTDLSPKEDDSKKDSPDKDVIVIHKPALIAAAVVLVVAVIATVFIVNRVRDYTTFSIQYDAAKTLYDAGDTDGAIKKLKHAMTLEDSEVKGSVLLADAYSSIGNYDAAIATLINALDENPDLIALYDRIIKCYEAQGDYSSIHSLIEYSGDESLKDRYSAYFPKAPDFSAPGGEYSSLDELILNSSENGSIYYTTDGSEPTKDSFLYEMPIPLEEGETTVSAIFINEYGISSDVASNTYIIKTIKPEMPVLLTKSGSYAAPNPIGVNEVPGLIYYFTTSSEIPTTDSTVYEMPMFMPLGKSEYTFIAVNENGDYSDSVNAVYELDIKAKIDKSSAVNALAFRLTALGDTQINYSYSCKSGYFLNGKSYYILYEMDGDKKTGRIFAVDSSSGDAYWVLPDNENKTYTLSPI